MYIPQRDLASPPLKQRLLMSPVMVHVYECVPVTVLTAHLRAVILCAASPLADPLRPIILRSPTPSANRKLFPDYTA